jgi:hypothetical protein
LTIIQKIRDKFAKQEYEFAVPHFFEEMLNDELTMDDIETYETHWEIQYDCKIQKI